MTVSLAARPSSRRRRSLRARDNALGYALMSPALALVLLFFVVPAVLMVWMSLNNWPLLGDRTFIGLRNYLDAFHDPDFGRAVVFTVIYAVVSTVLMLGIGLGLALLVRRARRGTGLFRGVFLLPYVMGFGSSAYLWYWLVDDRDGSVKALLLHFGIEVNQAAWLAQLVSAVIVVLTMVVWKSCGFYMLLTVSGMNAVLEEVYEAATLDGAGRWQQFWHITLPLLRPTIVMMVIFALTWGLLAFDQFFILTGGRPAGQTTTIVHWIYTMSFLRYRLGYGAALSVLVMIGLAVITAVQLRGLRDPEESR